MDSLPVMQVMLLGHLKECTCPSHFFLAHPQMAITKDELY